MLATRYLSSWVIGCSLLLGTPLPCAWSQQKSERQAEKLDVEELRQDLASRQESRVLGALGLVKSAPAQAKELTPDVERLLTKGTTLKISLNALRVLGDLGDVRSSKTIAPYVRHRSPNVRQTAASALLKTKGPAAIATLRAALRAPDPEVRNIAARGLGSLGAKEALADLFQALDHRVFAASVSIGRLCGPAECMEFMGRLGKLQLGVITSGTDEILFRPASEIDEKTKLDVIQRIAALRTLPATEYLIEVYKRWPKDASPSLKKALGDAIEDNGGDLGEDT